jgi:hypothetical protein
MLNHYHEHYDHQLKSRDWQKSEICYNSSTYLKNKSRYPRWGCLKMRVRKMLVLESANTLVSTGTENASTEYVSTENLGTKVFSQDNGNT